MESCPERWPLWSILRLLCLCRFTCQYHCDNITYYDHTSARRHWRTCLWRKRTHSSAHWLELPCSPSTVKCRNDSFIQRWGIVVEGSVNSSLDLPLVWLPLCCILISCSSNPEGSKSAWRLRLSKDTLSPWNMAWVPNIPHAVIIEMFSSIVLSAVVPFLDCPGCLFGCFHLLCGSGVSCLMCEPQRTTSLDP